MSARAHYLQHFRCPRFEAGLPAPIIYNTSGARALRWVCCLFAALPLPALRGPAVPWPRHGQQRLLRVIVRGVIDFNIGEENYGTD